MNIVIFESGKVETVVKDIDFVSPGKLAFASGTTGNVNIVTQGGNPAGIILPVEVIEVLNPRVVKVISTGTDVVGDFYIGFQ